ncbi:MAG: Hpt domain-containing protein [Opitutaceae bacterium]
MSEAASNERLAGLIAVLGDDETRELVRLFLSSTPLLLADMAGPDPDRVRRAAHNLKSSAQQMGASELSEQSRAIEARLHEGGPRPSPAEIALLQGRFRSVEKRLRSYAGP